MIDYPHPTAFSFDFDDADGEKRLTVGHLVHNDNIDPILVVLIVVPGLDRLGKNIHLASCGKNLRFSFFSYGENGDCFATYERAFKCVGHSAPGKSSSFFAHCFFLFLKEIEIERGIQSPHIAKRL